MIEKWLKKSQIGALVYKLVIFFTLLSAFLTGCRYRSIPPEITMMHFKKTPLIRSEVIILDPGHGGKDPGASSKKDRYEEKELALATTLMVRQYLSQMGYKVALTRNQDKFISLDARAQIANAMDADLFVSIHFNTCPDKAVEGIEVYYYKENKKPLPTRITRSKALAEQMLATVTAEMGIASRGVKQANFAVIRETKMPAILVESGFLSNPKEREKFRNPNYIRRFARSVANGIDKYLIVHRPRRESNARPAA